MNTIALIGGGCTTGKTFIQEAVDRDYRIKALVPDPLSFSLMHDNLTVIDGSSNSYENIKNTIDQTDVVVIFALEENLPLINLDIIGNLSRALRESQLNRLIVVIPAAFHLEEDNPGFRDNLNSFWFQLFNKAAYNQINDIIPEIIDSNFNWTLIRAPRLTNGIPEKIYEVGSIGMEASRYISRRDLSYFILKNVDEEKYVKKSLYISN